MSRKGHWVPARHNVAIGVMGGCELDFREAVFPPGVTEVHASADAPGLDDADDGIGITLPVL